MASRFMKIFFNTEKLAATNARYRARMAEINEKDAEVKAAITDARAKNKAQFHKDMAENNARLKAAWSK